MHPFRSHLYQHLFSSISKTLGLLLVALAFTFTTAHAQSVSTGAQVNSLDTLGYRLSVVSNVKDVALVTGMPQAEQITLANFFQKAEDTLSAAINHGSSASDLTTLQNQLVAQFQSILSAAELTAYRQQRSGSVYAQVQTGTTSN